MANKYIDKEYLLEQFKNYDSEVAEHKYSQSSVTVDSALNGTSENPVKNKAIKAALDDKQNKLVAGSNITINNSTNTISATNTNKLDDLIDTNISEPSNGQGLVYNNATGKWENATIQAGSQYTLPTASTEVLGGVKIDNITTKIDNSGVLTTGSEVITVLTMPEPSAEYLNKIVHCIGDSAYQNGNYYICVENTDLNAAQQPYKWVWRGDLHVAPTASDTNIGMVRPDGTTIQITSGGVISASGGGSSNVLSYDETLDVLGLPPNPIYRFRIATPIMTDYTEPSGEVIESGHVTSYYGWKPFTQKNDVGECWSFTRTGQDIPYLGYIFDNPKCIKKVDLYNYNISSHSTSMEMPSTILFQGSNDGTTWNTLATFNITDFTKDLKHEFYINNSNEYIQYRFYCTVLHDENDCTLGQINMYEKYLA